MSAPKMPGTLKLKRRMRITYRYVHLFKKRTPSSFRSLYIRRYISHHNNTVVRFGYDSFKKFHRTCILNFIPT